MCVYETPPLYVYVVFKRGEFRVRSRVVGVFIGMLAPMLDALLAPGDGVVETEAEDEADEDEEGENGLLCP